MKLNTTAILVAIIYNVNIFFRRTFQRCQMLRLWFIYPVAPSLPQESSLVVIMLSNQHAMQ